MQKTVENEYAKITYFAFKGFEKQARKQALKMLKNISKSSQ